MHLLFLPSLVASFAFVSGLGFDLGFVTGIGGEVMMVVACAVSYTHLTLPTKRIV